MREDEFLAQVRERGEYHDQDEARQVSAAVLSTLARRIDAGEADGLAAQLPGDLGTVMAEAAEAAPRAFGVEEFLRQVADGTGSRPRTAQWDAGAVLSTVADAVSGRELNHLLGQLPSGYAPLFGIAKLGD